jgi:hypothetical protein
MKEGVNFSPGIVATIGHIKENAPVIITIVTAQKALTYESG